MRDLSKKEIIQYLKSGDSTKLFSTADNLRRKYFKNEVCVRGIIEFSNHCQRNCFYCGLRKDNKNLKRYRISPAEIIKIAISAAKAGYKTLLLQSGEDSGWDTDALSDVIKKIKSKVDCAVTLSLGEKNFDEYEKLKKAGADRYLLRVETSSRQLFRKLKPDSSYSQRLACLKNLKVLGFQVGSGIMVGLPGQTYQVLAEDILLMRGLDLDMVGIGPFLAHHNTPCGDDTSGGLGLTLKVLALLRIMLPEAHIPATTAMGSVEKGGRKKALRCGANVIMSNLTPVQYGKYYQIYPNKIGANGKDLDSLASIKNILESLNRVEAAHRGDSIKKS